MIVFCLAAYVWTKSTCIKTFQLLLPSSQFWFPLHYIRHIEQQLGTKLSMFSWVSAELSSVLFFGSMFWIKKTEKMMQSQLQYLNQKTPQKCILRAPKWLNETKHVWMFSISVEMLGTVRPNSRHSKLLHPNNAHYSAAITTFSRWLVQETTL